MSLYYIFTIDGDWNEYFRHDRPDGERLPDEKTLIRLIRREIDCAATIGGKFIHFIHTSGVAGELFLKPAFVALWKEIERRGGSVGVHCHAEDLYRDGRLTDPDRVDQMIASLTDGLRANGLDPVSYRGGYLAFSEANIPILERHALRLDLSCDPGRHLSHGGEIVADWRGAPENYYRLSYDDHRKPGTSQVVEIPLGKSGADALYIDIMPLAGIRRAAAALAEKDRRRGGDTIVYVLSHTYEFASLAKRAKIAIALSLCKRFGTFISDKEALGIISGRKGV